MECKFQGGRLFAESAESVNKARIQIAHRHPLFRGYQKILTGLWEDIVRSILK